MVVILQKYMLQLMALGILFISNCQLVIYMTVPWLQMLYLKLIQPVAIYQLTKHTEPKNLGNISLQIMQHILFHLSQIPRIPGSATGGFIKSVIQQNASLIKSSIFAGLQPVMISQRTLFLPLFMLPQFFFYQNSRWSGTFQTHPNQILTNYF